MSNPQSQTLEASKYRPIVSAVLIALLVLLIFAARSHRAEDQGLDAYSTVDTLRTSAVLVADRPVSGG